MEQLFEAVMNQARKDEVYARRRHKTNPSVHEFIDGQCFIIWLERVGLKTEEAHVFRAGFWKSVEEVLNGSKAH